MAGITQTIPNYIGGMSEQPDQLKRPGQVKNILNGIPDVTYGLYKRPGAGRIGTNKLANVQAGGSWFLYYRDEREGAYLGQIAADGQVRVWRCSDGRLMTTAYGEPQNATIVTSELVGGTGDRKKVTITTQRRNEVEKKTNKPRRWQFKTVKSYKDAIAAWKK